jgi:hypothetical protein
MSVTVWCCDNVILTSNFTNRRLFFHRFQGYFELAAILLSFPCRFYLHKLDIFYLGSRSSFWGGSILNQFMVLNIP